MVMPKSIFMEHVQDIFDRVSANFFSSASLIQAFGDSLIIGPQNESDGSGPSMESQHKISSSEEKKRETTLSDSEDELSFSDESDYDHLFADEQRNIDLK